MKQTIIAAVLATCLATPALAQYAPPPPPGAWDAQRFWQGAPQSPRERIEFLQRRINRGQQTGRLDPREAADANRQLISIRREIRQMHYSDGHLTPRDAGMIQQRLDDLSRRIRWDAHNGY